MRFIALPVHNNQTLEIFVGPRGKRCEGFEVWLVGSIKGQRTVFDHFLTLENVEKQLSYAQNGDLAWQDAKESDIPCRKSEVAQESEDVMARGVFLDETYLYCYLAISQLPIDRKAWNAAQKSIIGRWTDGVATLFFESEAKFEFSCPPSAVPSRMLYTAAHHDQADGWTFSQWRLFLMNNAQKHGLKIGVWRCDERELHIFSGRSDVLVHRFHRVQAV